MATKQWPQLRTCQHLDVLALKHLPMSSHHRIEHIAALEMPSVIDADLHAVTSEKDKAAKIKRNRHRHHAQDEKELSSLQNGIASINMVGRAVPMEAAGGEAFDQRLLPEGRKNSWKVSSTCATVRTKPYMWKSYSESLDVILYCVSAPDSSVRPSTLCWVFAFLRQL